ncbi:hypothetical protein B0H13DRAFT_2297138, partial [Mycena leptocephala]
MFGTSGYRGTTADTASVSTCFPPSRPVALTLVPTVMASTPPNGKTVVVLGAASGGLLEGGIPCPLSHKLDIDSHTLRQYIQSRALDTLLTEPFRERPMHSIHPSHHPRPHPALPHPLVRGAQAEVEKDGVLCSDYAVHPTLHAPYAYGRTKAEGIAWLKRKQHVVKEAASVLVLVGVGSLGIQSASDIAAIHPTKHVM